MLIFTDVIFKFIHQEMNNGTDKDLKAMKKDINMQKTSLNVVDRLELVP